ncbi:TPA: hypothetical protein NO919_004933 [Klebsiella quasipneumoniae subsp. quasipneumoniae]|nr:hypothetical protein WP4S18E06_31670 [Klebsiella quasipneumoniae]HCI4637741.1 hypothetical protein [Klebsiella quasipneumoniae subsp. quasipneumoniae]
MNILDFIKNSWLLDEHFKGITGPLIVTICLWSVRSIRRLFFPFFWIFKNNLSSGFLKLSVDDKINALKLIKEYRGTDDKYEVLMKELKLKQYGLLYPVPILQVLFCYIHDNNIRINNTGFLSFLDCPQIFDYDRHTIPIYSLKKITLHLFAHTAFLLFLIYYIIAILRLFCELTYPPENIDSVMTILSLFIIFIITSRIAYIIIENSISFILAVIFSRKLKTYSSARKTNELMEKYNPTFLFLNGDKFK